MEALERLVSESFARHGIETRFDHRRLQWSRWFRCADGFSLPSVCSKPGLFALAEEVITPAAVTNISGRRMLVLFRISEAEDLGMALGRLFLPRSLEHERLASRCCFARYAVIEDAPQRRSAYAALQRWMASSAGIASGGLEMIDDEDTADQIPVGLPKAFPSGF